ncbi:MAG TPA: hypothetical protein VFR70_09585 [Flavobacterium sp.]|nr:hypothetical protein [Flavobacterium sp.]
MGFPPAPIGAEIFLALFEQENWSGKRENGLLAMARPYRSK